ncbi:hypothetical protein SAMN02745171_01083 [Porphyromonas circumdentaria]|uniref:Uncharacterized protein n=1 Tax=Porphyromonas circumdentaria TaxID=29524 RepID=A0A1T4NEF8_9PORP|nr:hypothetical protein [Porphyromonas circumdentaria]SJZ77387.1 hypothetical protein SAMN02745171_01083 [Porphyromonas circumdentaria]
MENENKLLYTCIKSSLLISKESNIYAKSFIHSLCMDIRNLCMGIRNLCMGIRNLCMDIHNLQIKKNI